MTDAARPWWQTSLLVAGVAMVCVGLALYLPPGRATVVLVAGAVVFVWTLTRNPAFWLRRLASASLGAALVLGASPMFSVALDLGSLGAVLVEHGDTTWLALGLLVAGVVLAGLEVLRERPPAPAPAPAPTATTTTTNTGGIHTQNQGDVALTAQGNIIAGNQHNTNQGGQFFAGNQNNTNHGGQLFTGPVTIAAPTPAAPPVDVDLQRHLQLVLEEVEFINIRGISSRLGASRSAIRRPIEELYTPLRTHRERDRGEFSGHRGERVELPELLPAHRHLLLIGAPGSGKSTFLQLVACMLARDLSQRPPPAGAPAWRTRHLGLPADGPAWIPGLVKIALLVPLFAQHSKKGRADDRWWLLDLLALRTTPSTTQADAGVQANGHAECCAQWDRWLREGRVMLLLDGLDEVADEGLRERVFSIFSDACRSWPACPIVVTSRPISTEALQTRGFHVATIAPFEWPEIERFVRQWAQALFDDREPDASGRKADLLLAALAERHELRRLAENPVMLTCLCVVHWNEGELPQGRARVYQAVFNWMLASRDDLRQAAGCSRELAERAFKAIALAMMLAPEGKQKTYSLLQAAKVIDPIVERAFGGDLQARSDRARRWLVAECEWSHLLEEVGEGRVQFWHLTMQEFAAALELARMEITAPRSWWEVIREHLDDPQWRETLELLPGCLHAIGSYELVDCLFEQLLKLSPRGELVEDARVVGVVGRLLAPMSAYDYKLSSGLQARFSAMQTHALAIFEREGARQVPASLRIAAAEALGRAGDPRISDKNFIELPGKGVRLGKYPVTVGEFARFIADHGYTDDSLWDEEGLRLRGINGWTGPGSWDRQKENPTRPVVEVSWSEARAYCRWLERRLGGTEMVRLPTFEEFSFAASPDGRRYPWGKDEPDGERANFKTEVGAPTPVGVYPGGAGEFGHQDLAGNVWGWCEDGEVESDLKLRYEWGDRHWITGGSWRHDASALAAVCRGRYWSRNRLDGGGFRVMMTSGR